MSGKHFRKLEWSMAAALKCDILSSPHSFDMQTVDRTLHAKSTRLPFAAFRAPAEERPLAFGHTEVTSSAPSWCSRRATNDIVPAGDLSATRQAQPGDDLHVLSQCWLRRFIDVSRNIIVKMQVEDQRLYGLVSLDDSGVLG